MIDLLKMVEALPDQDGKDAILEKVRELIGEKEAPEYSLVLSDTPYMAYEVHSEPDGTWRWDWCDEGGEDDRCSGFTTYRDTVRDIKRDIRDNLACAHDEHVRLLRALDKEIR